MKFAVDGMGGDFSPSAVVEGAVLAVQEYNDVELHYNWPRRRDSKRVK